MTKEERIPIKYLTAYLETRFFGMLLTMVRSEEKKMEATAGIAVDKDKKIILFCDPEKMEERPLPQRCFVLAHEASHIFTATHERRGDRDPKLWNYATDAIINELIIRDFRENMEPLKDPKTGEIEIITLENLKKKKLIPGTVQLGDVTADDIYNYLDEKMERMEVCGGSCASCPHNPVKDKKKDQGQGGQKGQQGQEGDQEGQGGEGDQEGEGEGEQEGQGKGKKKGKHQCGGGSGDEQGDGDQGNQKGQGGGGDEGKEEEHPGPGKGKMCRKMLEKWFKNIDENGLDGADGMDERLRQEIEVLQRAAQSDNYGSSAGNFMRDLGKIMKPHFPFKTILKKIFDHSKTDFSRPHRRLNLKKIFFPRKFNVKYKVYAAVDVSGSCYEFTEQFLGYIAALPEFEECYFFDVGITETWKKGQKLPSKAQGYGGTDLNPCMEKFKELEAKHRGIQMNFVVLTDGYIPELTTGPTKSNVIVFTTADEVHYKGSYKPFRNIKLK